MIAAATVRRFLFGAEQAIASVAEARDDIGVLVQVAVERRGEDLDPRMPAVKDAHAQRKVTGEVRKLTRI